MGGLVAALAAVAAWIRKPGGIAQVPVGVIVLGLYALNLWLRIGDSSNAGPAIALSTAGVSVIAVSSWLGGRAKAAADCAKMLLFASALAVSASLMGIRSGRRPVCALTQDLAHLAQRENAEEGPDPRACFELGERMLVQPRHFARRHLRLARQAL